MNWMACNIEFTDEFGEWWDYLTAQEQASVRLADKIYSLHIEEIQKSGNV